VDHSLSEREEAFQKVARTQPGSTAYVNRRPIHIRKRVEGQTLRTFLSGFSQYKEDPSRLERDWENGLLMVDGKAPTLDQTLMAGNTLHLTEEDTVEPAIEPGLVVVFEDEALMVVSKPAPMPVHPCGRFNKNTLTSIAREAWSDLRLHPVHRLDANTTGVMVFAKTPSAARALQEAFTHLQVDKAYSVRVHGRPRTATFEVNAAIEKDPSIAGTRELSEEGRAARTLFEVEEELPDGTSLLVARPRTGRTNQIRLHLHSVALPIVGDAAYGTNPSLERGLTSRKPLFLHARSLAFKHPLTQEKVCFSAEVPPWFSEPI